MKKITLIFFLCGLCFGSFAQFSIIPTSYFGSQRAAGMDAGIVLPDLDTVAMRLQVSLTSNFLITLSEPFDTLSNTSGAQDTLPYTHIIDSLAPGTWFIRLHGVSLVTGNVDTTMALQVTVTDSFVTPTISLAGGITPTIDGGTQPLNLNSGVDSAMVYVYVSIGDSFLVSQYQYMIDSFPYFGSGAYTYIFQGWPNPVTFSYSYIIKNSVGSDTSGIGALTLSNIAAWLSNVDSASVTDVTVTGHWHAATGDTDRVNTYHIALSDTGAAFNSFVENEPHQNVPIHLSHTFTGLADSTKYWIWSELSGFGPTARYMVTTDRTPIVFTLSSDTAYTSSLIEETMVVLCSSEVAVNFTQVRVSDNSSVNPSVASPFLTFAAGVWTQNVLMTEYQAGHPFIPGNTYYYLVEGVNTDGDPATSPIYSFVFMPQSTLVEQMVLTDEEVVMRGNVLEWRGEKEGYLLLYSTMGECVLKKSLHTGETVSLEELPHGIYAADFLSYGKSLQKKIVIQ